MKFRYKITRSGVDPTFCAMHSHLMVQLTFYLFGENMIFRKDLESPLIIIIIIFKEKQNRKENLKCDSLFGKDGM